MHVADLLSRRANLTPQREALLDLETGERFTFERLNERANRVANFLQRELGLVAGDRLAILAYNSPVYVDLFFAALKIGAIFVPLNWRLVAGELTYIINDCDCVALFYDPVFEGTLTEIRPNLTVTYYVTLGEKQGNDLGYTDILSYSLVGSPQQPPLNGEHAACIMYTSGTTGHPKGAIIPHRQILWNCINTTVSWGLSEHDVSAIFTPLFHAGGLFVFLTPLFYLGGRIVLARDFEAEASLQVIEAEKCTVVLGVPTLFQMWLKVVNFAEIDFSHMHFFISGGAPCPVPLMETWRAQKGVVFRQGYGLTEVGPNCFSLTDADSVRKAGSVGKPIFHSQVRLVNEVGEDVSVGTVGELLIAGPHVCSGYWHKPQATQQALRDGWFYTGDMAYRDEEGFYYIAGRFKDMIISGGENIYAAEVEAVMLEHPAVAEVALIGQPDEKWGEIGVMVVVLATGQGATTEGLQAFCGERLARYKIPKRIIFADSLPYSPYGKVMKAVLKETYIQPSIVS